jgi:hypothetical protein
MIHRLAKVCVPYQRERSKLRALLTPIAWATLTLAATACGAASDGAAGDSVDSENVAMTGSTEQALSASDIDATKSLLITDVDVVSVFTLKEVLDKLSNNNALALFHQMFATELQPGDPNAGAGPNCTGSINNWPAECPRAEGTTETASDPFADPTSDAAYMPTTLSNRFDLAPLWRHQWLRPRVHRVRSAPPEPYACAGSRWLQAYRAVLAKLIDAVDVGSRRSTAQLLHDGLERFLAGDQRAQLR